MLFPAPMVPVRPIRITASDRYRPNPRRSGIRGGLHEPEHRAALTGVAEGTLSILTGAYPYRIHEVAPYVTLVGIGAQCTGALTANADSWAKLPADLQAIMAALGVEYSEQVIAVVRARHEIAATNMKKEGAIFSTLGAKEKQRWIAALPDLATQWVERNEARGLPAREVLVRLMDGLRAEGVTPMRAWDEAVR